MLKLGKTKPQVLHIAATLRKKIPLFIQTADYFLSNALDKNILLNGASLKINGRKHSQIKSQI